MQILPQSVFLTVKDHSISGEQFSLVYDANYDMLVTSPKPSVLDLPRYYESEDYISHTDGNRSFFERLYQTVKSTALRRKLKLINSFDCSTRTLLDIGAGTGDFLSMAQKNGWNVTGTEPSEKAIAIAKSKGVTFAESLQSLASESFDVITMWHVLEHVPNLQEQIAELKRLLKPTGTIIIAVPNFKAYDAQLYGEYWAAYDVPRHLWHFSKTAIVKLFERQNILLTQVLPMPFDAYYVCLLSEKYKNGKMNFVTALWNGLLSNVKANRSKEYSSHIYILQNA